MCTYVGKYSDNRRIVFTFRRRCVRSQMNTVCRCQDICEKFNVCRVYSMFAYVRSYFVLMYLTCTVGITQLPDSGENYSQLAIVRQGYLRLCKYVSIWYTLCLAEARSKNYKILIIKISLIKLLDSTWATVLEIDR